MNPIDKSIPLRLRWTLGHVDLPAARRAPVKGVNRLLVLGAAMVVSCGLLMALDAPRTLGLFLLLLLGLESLVLALAAVGPLMRGMRIRGRGSRRRHPRAGGASGNRARQGHRMGHPSAGAVLDWRPLEWAQMGLLLLWAVVRN